MQIENWSILATLRLFVIEKCDLCNYIPMSPYLCCPLPAPPCTAGPVTALPTSLAPHSPRGRSLHGVYMDTDITYAYHYSHLAFYHWGSLVHHLGPDGVQGPTAHPGVAAGSTRFLNFTFLSLDNIFACHIHLWNKLLYLRDEHRKKDTHGAVDLQIKLKDMPG